MDITPQDSAEAEARRLLRLVASNVDNLDLSAGAELRGLEGQYPNSLIIRTCADVAGSLFGLGMATTTDAWEKPLSTVRSLHAANPNDPVAARVLAKNLDGCVQNYLDDGNLEAAKQCADELVALFRRLPSVEEIGRRCGRSMIFMMNAYDDQKNWPECHACFRSLLVIGEHHPASPRIGYLLIQGLANIAIVCRQSGHRNELLGSANAYFRAIGVPSLAQTIEDDEVDRKLDRLQDACDEEDAPSASSSEQLALYLVAAGHRLLERGRMNDAETLWGDQLAPLIFKHTRSPEIWLSQAGYLFVARNYSEQHGQVQAANDARDTLRSMVVNWTKVFKESESPAPLVETAPAPALLLPGEVSSDDFAVYKGPSASSAKPSTDGGSKLRWIWIGAGALLIGIALAWWLLRR